MPNKKLISALDFDEALHILGYPMLNKKTKLEPAKLSYQVSDIKNQEPVYLGDDWNHLQADSVLIININGLIAEGSSPYCIHPDKIVQAIKKADQHPKIGLTVLNFKHCDGGNLINCADITAEFSHLKKFVFSYIENRAVCAAYFIASQTEFIGASHSAETGGVSIYQIQWNNYVELFIKGLGINMDKPKSMGSSLYSAEHNNLKSELADFRSKQIAWMQDKRKFTKGNKDLLSNKIFSGNEAISKGFVDAVQGKSEFLQLIFRNMTK